MAALLAGCSLAKRRFVDQDGLPVEGALVFSFAQGQKFLGGAEASAFLTDRDGLASIVSSTWLVAIKPGYHVWTDAGHDDQGRSTEMYDEESVVLHRRTGGAQPRVHVSHQQVTFVSPEDEIQAIPLPSDMGVSLELVNRTGFRVRANDGQVSPSRRFYFAGRASDTWVADLRQEDDLFFYVQTRSGRVYKVGVTRHSSGSMTTRLRGTTRHVPSDALTLLWAELGGECSTIEPPARPVRIPWIDWGIELIAGPDPARVADALEQAVVRRDVEDRDWVGVWLSRLRGTSAQGDGGQR